jgi:epsilon-lactone hydrolase
VAPQTWDENMSTEMSNVREHCERLKLAPDLPSARRLFDELGESFGMPPGVVVTTAVVGSCPAEWIESAGAGNTVVLYLHGGGFMTGSVRSHRHLAAQIAKSVDGRALILDYRLAPEHIFPAALDDTLAAYRYLLNSEGIDPGQIAFVGDSAGGNLVVAALLAARDAGLPLPACGVCISPWIDPEATGASFQSKAGTDPAVTRKIVLHAGRVYFQGADLTAPPASILNADLKGLPPLLIQVGSDEVLLDDSTRLATLAAHHDVETTLEVWPKMVHVFPLFYPILTQGRDAIERASLFVRRHTAAGN